MPVRGVRVAGGDERWRPAAVAGHREPWPLCWPRCRLLSPGERRGASWQRRFSPGEGEERRWGRAQPFVCAGAEAAASAALPSPRPGSRAGGAGRGCAPAGDEAAGAPCGRWTSRERCLSVCLSLGPSQLRLGRVRRLPSGRWKNGSRTVHIHRFGDLRDTGDFEAPVITTRTGFYEDWPALSLGAPSSRSLPADPRAPLAFRGPAGLACAQSTDSPSAGPGWPRLPC